MNCAHFECIQNKQKPNKFSICNMIVIVAFLLICGRLHSIRIIRLAIETAEGTRKLRTDTSRIQNEKENSQKPQIRKYLPPNNNNNDDEKNDEAFNSFQANSFFCVKRIAPSRLTPLELLHPTSFPQYPLMRLIFFYFFFACL